MSLCKFSGMHLQPCVEPIPKSPHNEQRFNKYIKEKKLCTESYVVPEGLLFQCQIKDTTVLLDLFLHKKVKFFVL